MTNSRKASRAPAAGVAAPVEVAPAVAVVHRVAAARARQAPPARPDVGEARALAEAQAPKPAPTGAPMATRMSAPMAAATAARTPATKVATATPARRATRSVATATS